MTSCDMCGKEAELLKVRIEGAEMTVCERCARFGKLVDIPKPRSYNDPVSNVSNKSSFRPSQPSMPARKEIIQIIVPDYATKIREARERLGLKQEEFAKKLHEKESLMQKIEAGTFRPSIKTARKLEKALKIVLIDQHEEGNVPVTTTKSSSEGLTLGDFIKKRKPKK